MLGLNEWSKFIVIEGGAHNEQTGDRRGCIAFAFTIWMVMDLGSGRVGLPNNIGFK